MRTALSFKERDVTRALKAAAKAGHQVTGFEITKAGNIFVHTGKTGQSASSADDDWDKALANDR